MNTSRSPAQARPGLAILVIGAALAVGLGTPWFLDYDEAVYADVARGMWASGDWLRPVSNCAPFYEKPALFCWITASFYKLVGLTPVAPRLVSVLALLLGLVFLAREVERRTTAEAAEAVVWIAGASLLPFSLGRVGLLDALLTAALIVAFLALFRGLAEDDPGRRRGALALGYSSTGVALAVKGPAFPLLVAAVFFCDALVQRDARRTVRRSGILWGVPLVLAVGLPGYVITARAAGAALLTEFLGEHNLGRALTPMQGHQGSPLYYLAVLAAGLLPFTAFLPRALLRGGLYDPQARRLASFATVWGLLVVAGFSLVATKLPNYIAPAVPAFAIAVALALSMGGRAHLAEWQATVVLCAGFALLIAALPTLLARLPAFLGPDILKRAPELAHIPTGRWPGAGFSLAAALLAAGSVGSWLLARKESGLKAVRALGITGTLAWSVFLIAVGNLVNVTSITPVRKLAAAAAESLQPGAPIHVVEMNHRVTQNLETGRCTVFLRARTPAERDRIRAILAHDAGARVIVGDGWWEELRPTVGGRELARDGAYVLVAGGR
jgi:4-amino-4-deoxy-L-arabinose transferase-like glycosyltransferase